MLDFSFVVFVSPCPPHRAKGKKASERVVLRAHGFALVRHDSVFVKTYRHHHFLHRRFPFINLSLHAPTPQPLYNAIKRQNKPCRQQNATPDAEALALCQYRSEKKREIHRIRQNGNNPKQQVPRTLNCSCYMNSKQK